MRASLTTVGNAYASDRAFYTGLLVAWELLGILLNLAIHAGLAPIVIVL